MKSHEPVKAAPRSRGRPRDPDKREAILEAAARLFAERGIAPTSMEAVAERADVSKMTVYSNFRDKAELLKAVFARNMARLRYDELTAAPDAETAVERLVEYGEKFVGFLTRPEIVASARAMAESARDIPELAAAFYEAGPQANLERVSAFLGAGVAKGYWRMADANLAAETLLAAWLGLDRERQTFLGAPPPDGASVEKRVRSVTEIFARGWAASE